MSDRNDRIVQITDIETFTLEPWLDADNKGQDEVAHTILERGLDAEHYLAELDLKDEAVTVLEAGNFKRLLSELERSAISKFNGKETHIQWRVIPGFLR